MKKDIFNGKVKPEYTTSVLVSIILSSVVYLACAILFLCLGLFYNKVENAARIVLYVVSGVCFIFAVIYPTVTVTCVRTYPKHEKMTHVFVKPYFLNNEQHSTDDDDQ